MFRKYSGMITPAILIIAGAFIFAIYGILFVIGVQLEFSHRQVASEQSLNISEAGIDYYRWHLIQDPDDFKDGQEGNGPYIHDFNDPQGGVIGQFSLEITAPTQASPVVTIKSTGWTNQYSKIKRTIVAKYGEISLTRFAFLHDSNIWFGNDVTINGPVFSNGGIRQDGTNTSTVQSAKDIYICGIESGCNDPEEKPGVWGNGEIDELWSYPAVPIDFDNIILDFSGMKTAAQSLGLYLGPSVNEGYHFEFTSDGTVIVYDVTGVNVIKGYSLEEGCEDLYQEITSEDQIGIYDVSDNSIIFAEDNIWIDGVINGKTTIVAARYPIGTYNANIFINDNIVYLAKDGNHNLGLIAEKDIIIGRDVPDYLEINAALLAQNGRVIRHHYGYFDCKSTGDDKIKKELTFFGSMISAKRAYWNFSQGPGSPASGFQKSTINYDSSLYSSPPPYFPSSGTYEFLSWSEE